MKDDTVHSKSEEEEVIPDESVDDNVSDDSQMIPKSRLDKVISQREEALNELESVKEKVSELESLKDEIAELKESLKNRDDSEFTKDEEDALAKIDKGLKSRGYLTKAEFEETQRIDKRNSTIEKLADKYKRGSGYPEFRTDQVLVYAKKNGFGENLEAAYRDMHWDAIAQAIQKGTSMEPPDSEKPTGGERQKGTQLTTDQISDMDLGEYDKSGAFERFRKSIFGK